MKTRVVVGVGEGGAGAVFHIGNSFIGHGCPGDLSFIPHIV